MSATSWGHPAARYADPLAGGQYFAWQQAAGRNGAIYNLKFFAPFIAETHDVLDFGCGGGYLLSALRCREKAGIDINPAARAEAARRGVPVFASSAELSGRKFDRIVSSHCLEHVHNPFETLCKLRRLLRKDGRLILLLPIDDWRREPWTGPDDNGHLCTWTPRLLGNLLVSAGFTPVSIKVVNYAWPPRLDKFIWAVSRALFDGVAYLTSVALFRRQLWAIALPE